MRRVVLVILVIAAASAAGLWFHQNADSGTAYKFVAMSRSMLKRPLRTLPIIEAMRPWRAGQYQHSL